MVAPPAPAPVAVVKVKAAAPSTDPSQLSFSTLDFSTTALLAANASSSLLKPKKNRHTLPKDPNAALAVLAVRKERLEALNPEQRERAEEKARWEKVELKAGGEKVRDDEKRLKKMAKRQETGKAKSAKAWSVVAFLFRAITDSLCDAGRRGRRLSLRRRRLRSRSETAISLHELSRPRTRRSESRPSRKWSRPFRKPLRIETSREDDLDSSSRSVVSVQCNLPLFFIRICCCSLGAKFEFCCLFSLFFCLASDSSTITASHSA